MPLDVAAVRAQFPSLRSGVAFFDGPGGSQTPEVVAAAVASTLASPLSNRGVVTASERRADDVVVQARSALGDLLGVDPGDVVFGRSMTALTMDLARTLARTQGWGAGDEVVVSSLDHDANIRPWVLAAEAVGASVRWAEVDPATGELPLEAVTSVLSSRTRLVAVTGASNLLGTRPDVRAVADAAHEVGALVHVDAVHLAAHARVDRAALGADLLSCSPYKFFGPHLGVLVARPGLLGDLHPDKLVPSSDAVPERFELGTLPYELLAGAAAAVDVIAGWGGGGSRPDRLTSAFAAVEEHEDALRERTEQGLRQVEGLTLWSRAAHRTPTLLFTLEGVEPSAVHRHLARLDVNAPASHFYAWELSHRLGLGSTGGVRVGLAPYTSTDDVDRLLAGVDEVAATR
ncbi:cysteine desulfurase-like protein [Serinicoccus chungangensis]|uniref:cysteine desulfurase-like protein n=1 Tax=Serinicoccus chungangensis TaxID=767452 RepID=UPI00111AA62B|nr:cysteine desulfurase-like protein [Serinicoccus chungangensis]